MCIIVKILTKGLTPMSFIEFDGSKIFYEIKGEGKPVLFGHSYLWDSKLLANKKIAQVDNNYEQLDKVFKADLAINGDIKIERTGGTKYIIEFDVK